jgi:hypothetical protein
VTLIQAIDQENLLLLLDDGRQLDITGLYDNADDISDDTRVERWEDAVVFVAAFPDGDTFLIVKLDSISFMTKQ